MTIYIDLFYIICTVMNFIMLKIHSIFLSAKVSLLKMILGALLGGLLSIKSFMFGSGYIVDVLATFLILRIVYGRCRVRELVRRFFMFLSVMLMYSAMMNIFTAMCSGVFVKDGKMYSVLPIAIFLFGAIAGLIVILISGFFMRHRRNLYEVEIKTGCESIKTKAFLDTGNGLTEPQTGKPVIIIEDGLIKEAYDRKSIYLKTAVSENERLDMIKIEKITLLDENRVFEDLYAGISEHKLSKNGEFHALLNSKFAV